MSPSLVRFASVLFSCCVLLSSTATAFNITRLLDQYPDFKTFNDLLTQTKVNQQINQRQTITILTVSDDKMSEVSSKPVEAVKKILSSHVILDYYDTQKLKNLKTGTSVLTTLLQTTGTASSQQGFLNVTLKDDKIVFSSAVKNPRRNVMLTRSVAAQPFNISVLEVSGPIIVPGLDAAPTGPVAAPAPMKAHAPAPAPHKKKRVAKSPEAETLEAEAPSDDALSPDDAPASFRTEADAPAADETPDKKSRAPSKSSAAGKGFVLPGVGLIVMLMLVASFLTSQ
ncbi:hypothetical protein RJ639_030295 [Escallonia herrerae]|uniref:FAS1 domain-containing protein n=1 Tax=Escallonia herrerae TaxID=1293975 RepID=A0AA89BEJ2_9ASTE|nr:hypothetical protein RJ639_030295 [Escallonia herrerae]